MQDRLHLVRRATDVHQLRQHLYQSKNFGFYFTQHAMNEFNEPELQHRGLNKDIDF